MQLHPAISNFYGRTFSHIAKVLLALVFGFFVASCTTNTTTTPVAKPAKRAPIIAIALGGGGAKGFAHIGVLKVLESHGIKPKIVTGTSAGSFVGAMYASGLTPLQLQTIANNFNQSEVRDLTFSGQGMIVGQKLQDYVNAKIGNKLIEQFPLKFAAVATQLSTGKAVAFVRGNAGQAVRASCSIPNVFVPAVISGQKYVDGGLVAPIPVGQARAMGADIVIAVDISSRPKATDELSLFSILDQTINIMGQGSINSELAQADVVIKPAVGTFGTLDLNKKNESIVAGEDAGQKAVAQIKQKIAAYYAN